MAKAGAALVGVNCLFDPFICLEVLLLLLPLLILLLLLRMILFLLLL